jgi:uncharacterized protein YuzE
VEEAGMREFKVYYDEIEDILYLGKEGEEHEALELAPGIMLELNKERKLIGIEFFKASLLFRDIIKPLVKRLDAA